MNIIYTNIDIKKWRNRISKSVGFIPTMGALHNGHLSLIEQSIKKCSYTVVSIFLNPKQFGDNEDLSIYPLNIKKDLKLLSNYKIDTVFIPSNLEVYPKGFSTYVEEKYFSKSLEGKSRPSFFQGVTTVVCKLFNIIRPTHAFFGQKDAQQLIIIRKMVFDLSFDIDIVPCPTIREKNGLALSSRNEYFSNDEKEYASNFYQALQIGYKSIIDGERSAKKIKKAIIETINEFVKFKIDYVSIINMETHEEVESDIYGRVLVSSAIFLKGVRLIDNFIYNLNKS